MPNPTESRRSHPRVDVNVSVDIVLGNQFFTGFSENLSSGGIFVATSDIVPIGTQVDISFTVPGYTHTFFAAAQVRWIREESAGFGPGGMGIQFSGMSQEDQDLLYEILGKVETIFFAED